ncbi:hypothetical protein JMJ55_09420 [Belnapia sp. T6]|uniref:Uncharacterized protein n=1 Tax=Belnapia mucosa TaxID=2804532 RepID=A0ABS1V340_9PROT|nr:hypothetical protein [Belnapia mucosa]MBL6455541.1 hypothetical protein [Belnapia mucosa]
MQDKPQDKETVPLPRPDAPAAGGSAGGHGIASGHNPGGTLPGGGPGAGLGSLGTGGASTGGGPTGAPKRGGR